MVASLGQWWAKLMVGSIRAGHAGLHQAACPLRRGVSEPAAHSTRLVAEHRHIGVSADVRDQPIQCRLGVSHVLGTAIVARQIFTAPLQGEHSFSRVS